jgi:hypothetical protein
VKAAGHAPALDAASVDAYAQAFLNRLNYD